MQSLQIKTIIFIFLFISLGNQSCNNKNDAIPDVFVNIEIDLNNPDFSSLQIQGNYVYITGGVSGIIIYRKTFEEFIALERACPHDPEVGRITVDIDNHAAVDTVACGSVFSLLMDGMVLEGPSKFPLRLYNTVYYENINILHITN